MKNKDLKKSYNMKIESPAFRKSLSLDKKTIQNRYAIVYKETFQTNVPGTAAHIIYHSKNLLKNKRILDLGCGAGRLSLYSAKFAKSVTGIDYIPRAIFFANKFAQLCNVKNVNFLTGDIDKSIKNKYDVVLISDVLQHVNNPKKTLEKTSKLLKPKGWAIISIPSFTNFRGNVWLALQNLFELPMSLTDTYQISLEEMKKWANQVGFNLVKTVGISYDWAWSIWGIEDLKRRIYLATKDAKMTKFTDMKKMNSWLDENIIPNKQFLDYLIKKKIVKKRPKFSVLKIPKTSKEIKTYLDDGNTVINPYYSTVEPFNRMGAGIIYFLNKNLF